MIYGFTYKYLKDFINDSTVLTGEELETLELIEKQFRKKKEKNKMVEVLKIPKKERKTTELTPTEQKIFDALMDGLNYKETAELLNLAQTTIKTHVNSIFQKRTVSSLQQLVVDEYKKRLSRLQKEHLCAAIEPKANSILEKIENRLQKAKDELAQTAQEVGFLYLKGENLTYELREKADILELKIKAYSEIMEEVTNEQ